MPGATRAFLKTLEAAGKGTGPHAGKVIMGGAAVYGAGYILMPRDPFGKGKMDTGSGLLNFAGNFRNMPGINSRNNLSQVISAYKDPQASKAMQTYGMGAAAGGTLGGTVAGIAMAVFSRGRRVRNGLWGMGMGAIVGAWQGVKATRTIAQTSAQMHRHFQNLGKMPVNRRSTMRGSGYRSWAKLPGRGMPVGHMGMTGNTVLSMHKVRNRRV